MRNDGVVVGGAECDVSGTEATLRALENFRG